MVSASYFCWAIHLANVARSSSVMLVLFAGGIVFVTTARSLIRATRSRICAGVSNETPAGDGPNVRSTGWAEWHTLHRRSMMCRASSNVTVAGALTDAAVGATGIATIA